MAKFDLKNQICFELNSKQQILGTEIDTKFAPSYVCIFTDKVGKEFLYKELLKPWVCLRYIDDISFVSTHGKNEQSLVDIWTIILSGAKG